MTEYDPSKDRRNDWGGKWAFRGYLAAAIIALLVWGFFLDLCQQHCLRVAHDALHTLVP